MKPGKEKRVEAGIGKNRRLPQVPTGDFVDNMSRIRRRGILHDRCLANG